MSCTIVIKKNQGQDEIPVYNITAIEDGKPNAISAECKIVTLISCL
jgi:hypothetical protein